MSALFGIFNKNKKIDREAATVMQAAIQHEAWYQKGNHDFNDLGITIGFTTSKGELSEGIPFYNDSKDIILFWSGEIYNELNDISHLRIVRNQLSKRNAGYLVYLYEELGEKFFEELNGFFFGIILDMRKNVVFLFNDRYGMKRVFYHENKNNIYFSTEAKALLSILPEVREFDNLAVAEFLTCGCTIGYKSLYKNISVLPHASLWVFNNGEISKNTYFDATQWDLQKKLDEKRFVSAFIDSFGSQIKKYLKALTPVGISLTGGLDSRMIASCLKNDTVAFFCYTFGGMYRESYDVKIAREVASCLGLPFIVLTVDDDFLNQFEILFEKAVYISDGYIGFQGATELYLNRMARNISPIRLTGNYGGEVLRRVRAFKYSIPKGRFFNTEFEPMLSQAEANFRKIENIDPISFSVFCQAPFKGFGRLSVECSQVQMRTPFMDNNLVKLLYQAPETLLNGNFLSKKIIESYGKNLLKIPTDGGLLGKGMFSKTALRQIYQESLFKAEYWSSHGMPGWLAQINKYLFGNYLEKLFIGRHKFQHFRLWTQRELSNFVQDTLKQGIKGLDEFFDVIKVEKLLADHMSGKDNYTNEIDLLLTIISAKKSLLKQSR